MNGKIFVVSLLIIVFTSSVSNILWADDKKNSVFSVTPAISFSWYPYTNYEEESTKTDTDINNLGMSIMLGLKLFDKVGAHLNLKIDDPSFQKMVDLAGYINAFSLLMKFDYRSFGGNVTWQGDTMNPITRGKYNFYNQWNTVSLMYQYDKMPNLPYIMAVGIAYSNFEMPVEYQIKEGRGLTNPGFGMIRGKVWGISAFIDTLIYTMNQSAEERSNNFLTWPNFFGLDMWIYMDLFCSLFIKKGEIDKKAISWMVNSNNGISIDNNITRKTTLTGNDNGSPNFLKMSAILGFQKVWELGKNRRIGFAAGVDFLIEYISADNDDIKISLPSTSVGPTIRLSAKL